MDHPHAWHRKRDLLPLLLAILAYAACLAAILVQAWKIDRGVQLYSLDDPYIHLAIAKNLVLHGVYGVTPAHFSAASSSILWPFLLAGLMLVFGVHPWLALALNILLSLLLLGFANSWLNQLRIALLPRTIALLSFALLIPLPGITVVGLEHILHALTATGLLFMVYKYWQAPARDGIWILSLWAALATCSRYEAAFQVACIFAVYVLTRQFLRAIAVSVAGFLPILAFGLFSLDHPDGHFFPNSLLVKTHNASSQLSQRLQLIEKNIHYLTYHLLILTLLALAAMIVLSVRRFRRLTPAGYSGLIVLGTTVCQVVFAFTGQAGRYEAFIVALLIMALTLLATERSPGAAPAVSRRTLALALGLFGIATLIPRAWVIMTSAGRAIESIYLQQYQMAQFFLRFYPDTPVAINDVGAVNFYGHADNFDVYGLASPQVLNAKLAGKYDTAEMAALAKAQNVHVVAVYRSWFSSFPPGWTYAGSLTPQCSGMHYTVGGSTIAFYATVPEERDQLHANLESFGASLPPHDKITDSPDTAVCLP